MSNQIEVRLPRGRLVHGHPMKMTDRTNMQTGQKVLDEHGRPKQECYIQVAVPKADPGLYGADGVFMQIQQVAGRALPQDYDFKADAFSWKIDDGDQPVQDKETGQWKSRPEHCLGHWLFNIKSYGWIAKTVYQAAPGQPHQEMMDPSMIKTGDFVDMVVRCEPNGAMGPQAGIFMKPALVRFNEAGGAISTGGGLGATDADSYFAGSNAQAPVATGQPPMQQPGLPPQGGQPGLPPQGGQSGMLPQGGQSGMLPQGGQPPLQQSGMLPQGGQPPLQQSGMLPQGGQPPLQGQAPMPGQPGVPQPNYDPNFAAGPDGTVPTA